MELGKVPVDLFLISFASCPTWISRFLNVVSFYVIYSFSRASILIFWAGGGTGDCGFRYICGAGDDDSTFCQDVLPPLLVHAKLECTLQLGLWVFE